MVYVSRSGFFSLLALVPVALHGVLTPYYVKAVPATTDNSTSGPANVNHVPSSVDLNLDDGEQFVHPWIKLQQQVSHGERRMARFNGNGESSEKSIDEALTRRQSETQKDSGNDAKMLNFRPPRVKSHLKGEDFDERDAPPKRREPRFDNQVNENFPDLSRRGSSGYSSTVAKKQESYSVTNAPDVSVKNSAGLAIEANDVGYFVEVQIGSDNTKFKLLVDSGSSDTWVTGQSCKNCGPSDRQKLGKSTSQSLKTSNDKYKISYGTGNVGVTMVTDSIEVAGLSINDFTFGMASSESDDFGAEKIPFDGLLGLGSKSLSITHQDTLVDALVKNNQINKPIVGVRLGRAADGSSGNKGRITFGGVDQSQIDGSLTQIENQSKNGYWAVKIDNVSVDSDQVSGGSTAVLDTGTSLIIAPKSAADKIHNSIPGAKPDGNGGYTIPCTTSKTVSFTINGNKYDMDSRDLLFAPKDTNNLKGTCISAISTGQTMDDAGWLLGAAFLKNVYFATNSDANQIGLGKLKN